MTFKIKFPPSYVWKEYQKLRFTKNVGAWAIVIGNNDINSKKLGENSVKLGGSSIKLIPTWLIKQLRGLARREKNFQLGMWAPTLQANGETVDVQTSGHCPACGLWMHKVINLRVPAPLRTDEQTDERTEMSSASSAHSFFPAVLLWCLAEAMFAFILCSR